MFHVKHKKERNKIMTGNEIITQMEVAQDSTSLQENEKIKQLATQSQGLMTLIASVNDISDYDNAIKGIKEFKKETNAFIKEKIKPVKQALAFLKDKYVGQIEKDLSAQVDRLESELDTQAILLGLVIDETPAKVKTEKVACCNKCGSTDIIYKVVEVK